jgi:SLT domain-containing protein
VALLIIKYHKQIWAFIQKVWHDVLAVIMGVWTWVKTHWPLLLGIITGPVGLAILWIVQHFGQITTAVRTVLGAVSRAWNAVWNTLKAAFRIFVVYGILGPLGLIVHGAAAAFGWVPGLGGKLKGAAKAFDTFKASVNRSLGGINGRTVNVGVHMTSSTNPYPGGISGRKAAGGRITGPGGPRDDRAGLYALSNNEWVIRADSAARYGHTAMAAVNEGRAYIGYAGGGVAVKASAPGYAAIESSLMASVTKLAQAFARAAAAVSATVKYKPGGGVQQWRGTVSQALSLAGSPQQLIDAVLYQMQTESGGNPTIVNRWDSNWLAGHPSVGLMQVIRGTFQAYAGRFRGTGPFEYGVSVNPLANVYAAIKYAQANYGPGLRNAYGGIGSGHGYALGTASASPGWAWVGERGPELVRFRGGEQVRPAGGGNTYNITVNVPPTASKADTGRVIVEHIREYERGSGPRWRK